MTRALLVVIGFVLMNNLVDIVLKPKLMQQGLHISVLEIFLSLLFWSWVLGLIGAVLAVLLTMVLKRFVAEFLPEQCPASALAGPANTSDASGS